METLADISMFETLEQPTTNEVTVFNYTQAELVQKGLQGLKIIVQHTPSLSSLWLNVNIYVTQSGKNYDLKQAVLKIRKDQQKNYDNFVLTIKQTVDSENKRIAALPADKRDEKYIADWEKISKEALDYIKNTHISL